MNKKIQLIIFILVFLLVYICINSYAVLRLGGLLGIPRSILYLWIGLVTFSLPVSLYIERIFPTIVSRIFYVASTLWMGILLFTVCSLLIFESISLFYVIPHAGMLIVIAVTLLSIISVINAWQIVVKEVNVPIKNLKKEVTIVQLSDLHLGTIRNSGFLKKISEKIKQLDPDIVMITGDMVDASTRLDKSTFSDLDLLRAPVYFVTGNHEIYENTDKVYEHVNDTKIKVLRNEAVEFAGIQIIGIEFSQNKGHLERELEKLKIDKTKPAVLMYHCPEGIEDSKKAGIDLQLAGHTHAGQLFPFNFFVRIVYKHIKGLYDLGDMYLYVSPGTGTWGPYMRLGSRNEITLLKLIAK